jgi:NAD(P)-dependent dehydrogenase (short-subunit alcohol dehydrogenase family)
MHNTMSDARVALVTGGANGIGNAVARRLARGGYAVAILDVEDGPGGEVAADIERENGRTAQFLHCDVTSEAEIGEAVERVSSTPGSFGAVVHCVGADTYDDPLTMSAADFDSAMALNLRSAWLVARTAALRMGTAGGSIVLVSSVHAFQTRPNRFPYPVAKAGMVSLARSLALDLGPRRIRVNAICPGFVRTRLLERALEADGDIEPVLERIGRKHPLGRIGQPEDIAGVAHFLVGDEATFITGTAIVVDGGLTSMLPD